MEYDLEAGSAATENTNSYRSVGGVGMGTDWWGCIGVVPSRMNC